MEFIKLMIALFSFFFSGVLTGVMITVYQEIKEKEEGREAV